MINNLIDRKLASLEQGMTSSVQITITEEDLNWFRNLTGDNAPVHYDSRIANEMGYERPIVYGFLVFSRFSALLGMNLPGPRAVIHSASYKMVNPVYVGDQLTYQVEIKKIVKSIKVTLLNLTVFNFQNKVVLRGEAQCGFRR